MNNRILRMMPMFLMLVGVCMIVYPIASNLLYEKERSFTTTEYEKEADALEDEEAEALLEAARTYNESLLRANIVLTDPFDPALLEQQGSAPYRSLLNYAPGGVMGYVSIPVIDVNLPIYHGTSAQALEKGAGHLERTSLPVGGASTHCVLTGHTGLAGKRLLTDLTEVEEGDVFYLHVLKDLLAYKVTEISVVEPEETQQLQIEVGKDKATLLTCYPYGVNSHRLLVTGERTSLEDAKEQERAMDREAKSVWQAEYKKSILLCLAIYVPLIFVGLLLIRRRKSKSEEESDSK